MRSLSATGRVVRGGGGLPEVGRDVGRLEMRGVPIAWSTIGPADHRGADTGKREAHRSGCRHNQPRPDLRRRRVPRRLQPVHGQDPPHGRKRERRPVTAAVDAPCRQDRPRQPETMTGSALPDLPVVTSMPSLGAAKYHVMGRLLTRIALEMARKATARRRAPAISGRGTYGPTAAIANPNCTAAIRKPANGLISSVSSTSSSTPARVPRQVSPPSDADGPLHGTRPGPEPSASRTPVERCWAVPLPGSPAATDLTRSYVVGPVGIEPTT